MLFNTILAKNFWSKFQLDLLIDHNLHLEATGILDGSDNFSNFNLDSHAKNTNYNLGRSNDNNPTLRGLLRRIWLTAHATIRIPTRGDRKRKAKKNVG